MSTFLELAGDLRREAGINGTGPSTVVSQTGEMQRVVEWILTAYRTIQNLHHNWLFLQNDFSFNTVAATQTYTPTTAGCPELGRWKDDTFQYYLTSVGVNGQQDLMFVPWDDFSAYYLRGSLQTQSGPPDVITIRPNRSLMLWPIPDAIYTISGEYYKRAQTMAADADEPLIPPEFQDAIVWRALMMYGAYEGASEKYSHGQNEYKHLLSRLELNQLPEFELGDALT